MLIGKAQLADSFGQHSTLRWGDDAGLHRGAVATLRKLTEMPFAKRIEFLRSRDRFKAELRIRDVGRKT